MLSVYKDVYKDAASWEEVEVQLNIFTNIMIQSLPNMALTATVLTALSSPVAATLPWAGTGYPPVRNLP